MIIKVPVDRRECFRKRIECNVDVLDIEIAPGELTDQERDWIAERLKVGGEFAAPTFDFSGICPPAKEEFPRVVQVSMRSSGEDTYSAA